MRFLSIYKTAETNVPPTLEHMARMEKLIEDAMKSGKLVATADPPAGTRNLVPATMKFGSRILLARARLAIEVP